MNKRLPPALNWFYIKVNKDITMQRLSVNGRITVHTFIVDDNGKLNGTILISSHVMLSKNNHCRPSWSTPLPPLY